MTSLASPIDSPASRPVSAATDTRVPAAVRENVPGARQAYASAQSFEELLLNQLSQSLMQSSGLTGEGEDGENSQVASLLPQTLTEGVMHAGGLGLAAQLMNAVDPQLGHRSLTAVGGASA